MRTLRALTGRRHLAVWLGLAVVVIGGLLGMHALNLHAQTPPHHHRPRRERRRCDRWRDDTRRTDPRGDAPAAAPVPSPCDDCGGQSAGHEAAMACVLALLMTLLLLPARRLLATLVERIQWHASTPALHGFDPTPTRSLYELSVIRTSRTRYPRGARIGVGDVGPGSHLSRGRGARCRECSVDASPAATASTAIAAPTTMIGHVGPGDAVLSACEAVASEVSASGVDGALDAATGALSVADADGEAPSVAVGTAAASSTANGISPLIA